MRRESEPERRLQNLDVQTPRRPPALRAVLRHLFFQTYDHLGGLIVLNLAWTVLNLPWMLVAGLLTVPASVFARAGRADVGIASIGFAACFGLVSPPTVALLYAVLGAEGGIAGGVRRLLEGLRRRFWAAQAVGLLMSGGAGLLAVNLGYYARLGGFWRPVGWGLVGVVLWACVGLLVLAPMWIAGSAKTGHALKTFVSAARLLMSYPGFCVGTSVVTGLILLFGVATGVGPFLGAVSVAGLWVRVAFEALSSAQAGAAYDLSESRSLRGLWRPWEGEGRGA